MPKDFAHYALRHPDGRWLYHLAATGEYGSSKTALADGQPMTRLAEKSSWWHTDHEAARITLVTPAGLEITGYELRDAQALSVRFPAELTVEDWNGRIRGAGDGQIDTLYQMYRSVTVEGQPVEQHFDGPFPVLEASDPPAPDGPNWTPNLLDSITQRPEYRHLFPGHLSGLRKHLVDLIKRMPRVSHCFDGFQGSTAVYVSLRVRFEQAETVWVANTNRRGDTLKSGRNREVTVDRVLHLPVSDTISGANHADALAEWNRQVAFWTQAVTDATVAACNHCRGTGHVPAGSENYTHTK